MPGPEPRRPSWVAPLTLLRPPPSQALLSVFANSAPRADEEPPVEPLVGGGRMPASPLFRPSNLRCVNTLSGHHSGIRAIAYRFEGYLSYPRSLVRSVAELLGGSVVRNDLHEP